MIVKATPRARGYDTQNHSSEEALHLGGTFLKSTFSADECRVETILVSSGFEA